MIDAGLFRGERLELLAGIIVRAGPQSEAHALAIQILNRVLVRALGDRADVRVRLPFAASGYSLPDPDLAVVKIGRFGDPHPSEAFFLIEVADSSLDEDRVDKARLYAEAGAAEYWVVNVRDRIIEVHSEPTHDAYTRVTPHRPGDLVRPLAFPDVTVPVASVVGAETDRPAG